MRLFVRAYRWRRIDPVPWSPLNKPLGQCRLGLVSSAGLVAPDQAGFDSGVSGGDASYRAISDNITVGTLVDTHRSESYDHSGIVEDPNLAFPIDRVHELAQAGRIGSVNRRHLTFMGSIITTGRLIRETAPQAAQLFVEDRVDVALLVPV